MTTSSPPKAIAFPPLTVTFQGSRLARWLLARAGWTVHFDGAPAGGGVIIAYPHTSNWDFIVGILTRWALGIPLLFLGKDSLFSVPVLGTLMRCWGGIPVDRSRRQGMIEDLAAQLRAARADGANQWIAITPEGTRSYRPYWRGGFYHLAVAAQAPIGLAWFNYRTRDIGVTHFFMPSGDADTDLAHIADWYARHAQGLYPKLAAPVCLTPRD